MMPATSIAPVRVDAVIVAAGRGERAGQSIEGPKQYRRVGGVPVLARSVALFRSVAAVRRIVIAIHADDEALCREALGAAVDDVTLVTGGPTRQVSTLRALEALEADPPDRVLIHDAVRPFASSMLVQSVIAALDAAQGAIPAVPVSDTLKTRSPAGTVAATVDRSLFHAAQTPQGFPYRLILDAHRRAADATGTAFTDDASIAEWADIPVLLVPGEPGNVKLTYAADIQAADLRLKGDLMQFPDIRTGNGYDVHAFESGDHVTLCGVAIPHEATLSGHSDADVALHALTDALLATCGAGDIGTHFPPSDPQWRGAASRIFVEHAVRIVRSRGGRIANADITLIAEAPKVGPYRAAMTAALADMLGIAAERVSVKATTNERLGFIGRREGIAAIATASVAYPGGLEP